MDEIIPDEMSAAEKICCLATAFSEEFRLWDVVDRPTNGDWERIEESMRARAEFQQGFRVYLSTESIQYDEDALETALLMVQALTALTIISREKDNLGFVVISLLFLIPVTALLPVSSFVHLGALSLIILGILFAVLLKTEEVLWMREQKEIELGARSLIEPLLAEMKHRS
jgi:hypothetical protein